MNWSDISAQMGELLGDPEKATFSDAVRRRAFNGAQDYFAISHTAPLLRVAGEIDAVASHWEMDLPARLIKVAGVETATRWLEPQLMQPGEPISTVGYVVMPGLLYFGSDPGDVTLWYYALYPWAIADNTAIALPEWSIWAVTQLALAYTLTPKMISQTNLRAFQEKRDAGTPEMNPARVQANWHIKQYMELVSMFAPQDREVAFKPGR
jgi:hypothetical protein